MAKNKAEQSARLAADVATFLANGGTIHQVTHEETKMARDHAKKMAKRATSGAVKFTTSPHRLGDGGEAMKQKINRELHPWVAPADG